MWFRYDEPPPQENAQTVTETSADIDEPAATAPLLTNPLPELENAEPKIQEPDAISSHSVSAEPLKERNSGPMILRESTSFDPREPCKSAHVDKENNTKPADESIQINEISSSNIEESGAEPEAPASAAATPSSGLRRAKPSKTPKRKLEPDDHYHQQRKSLRLTLTQKILEEAKKPAPCTLAEEKLKKLAAEAEKCKTRAGREKDLSLTQKVLNRKKALMKKKLAKSGELKKSKLKLIFDMVVAKGGKRKLAQKNKEKAPDEENVAGQKGSRGRKVKSEESQDVPQGAEVKRSGKKPMKSKTVLAGECKYTYLTKLCQFFSGLLQK